MPDNARPTDELHELAREAQNYSQRATQLSDLLEEVERFFQDLPAKAAVDTETDRSTGTSLRFAKATNGEWCVWIFYPNNGQMTMTRITSAPVKFKICAAKLLGELYEKLKQHYADLNCEVDEGISAIANLHFMRSTLESRKGGEQ
jgi:hypothetical protein